MHIEVLTSFHKPAMRALIAEIIAEQGLLESFYWPQELLGPELATAEMIGVLEGTEVAGFILYRELPDVWEISLVATHPKFRRRGYMEKLFEHFIAAKGQSRQLWLEVHEENVPAQKLYEKLGFTEVRRRPRYYKDGGTAVLYTLS